MFLRPVAHTSGQGRRVVEQALVAPHPGRWLAVRLHVFMLLEHLCLAIGASHCASFGEWTANCSLTSAREPPRAAAKTFHMQVVNHGDLPFGAPTAKHVI